MNVDYILTNLIWKYRLNIDQFYVSRLTAVNIGSNAKFPVHNLFAYIESFHTRVKGNFRQNSRYQTKNLLGSKAMQNR